MSRASDLHIGIDLGTTNSVITYLRNGRPVPIAIDGDAIVPSVVYVDKDGGFRVGREARNLQLSEPERTIRSVKRKMGLDHRYEIDGRSYAPADISAAILSALKTGAEKALGQPISEVIVTVPAYFDDAQRRATLRAGELAKLHVLRLLNEPTSASLVYDQVGQAKTPAESEIVVIYDLGGGTFDVSVLDVAGQIREVRSTAGNTALGGDDFDDRLLQVFLDDLKAKHGVDPREDARAMAKLRRLAEETKIKLSLATSVDIREEFLTSVAGKPIHLETTVTRRQFEDLIRSLLESTIEHSRKALEDAKVDATQISRVCLVGGSTRIPLVRSLIEEAFGAPIHEDVDPDLAVGLGASLQAGLLRGAAVERILVDVSAHSLGMRVIGNEEDMLGDTPDTFAPILRRNTVLPAQRAEEFYTMVDDQERLEVEVFQGEARLCSQNTRVGSFRFDLVPVPERSPIKVEFAYDLNGVIRVEVSQPGKNNAKTVALKVADAGKKAQKTKKGGTTTGAPANRPDSPIVRKARALLPSLSGDEQRKMEDLLAKLSAATNPGDQENAEDALLDLFLDHEAKSAGKTTPP
ncbi:MAG TPA: Hsp70 family protein [Polyangia bacterium]